MTGPGGGAGTGVEVDPERLRRTAQGIRDTVAALGEMGAGPYHKGATAFRGMALSADDLGHDGLTDVVTGFVAQWSHGVRALVASGEELADGLEATGIAFAAGDEQGAREIAARWYHVFFGNPGEDSADAAAQRPFGDLVEPPDHSAESISQASERALEIWGDQLRDSWDVGLPGSIGRALDGENPLAPHIEDARELGEIVE